MTAAILETRAVTKRFDVVRGGPFARRRSTVTAVDGVDLRIDTQETLGLVGESGCGKTTLTRLLLMLEQPSEGRVEFDGRDLRDLTRAELRHYRRSVQPVFQNPYSALSPRMRVRRIVAEPLLASGSFSARETAARVDAALEAVGLSPQDAIKYPSEFSGGQRQRIAIARSLACEPRLILLDEAVSSQDVSIRAQILNLLKDLQAERKLSYLFVAHDLATVRYLCDRVAVMYLGRIVESTASEALFERPLHPYTQALIASALPDDPDSVVVEPPLKGEVPSPLDPPPGCHFHTRCPHVRPECSRVVPPLREVAPGHWVRCVLYE